MFIYCKYSDVIETRNENRTRTELNLTLCEIEKKTHTHTQKNFRGCFESHGIAVRVTDFCTIALFFRGGLDFVGGKKNTQLASKASR